MSFFFLCNGKKTYASILKIQYMIYPMLCVTYYTPTEVYYILLNSHSMSVVSSRSFKSMEHQISKKLQRFLRKKLKQIKLRREGEQAQLLFFTSQCHHPSTENFKINKLLACYLGSPLFLMNSLTLVSSPGSADLSRALMIWV